MKSLIYNWGQFPKFLCDEYPVNNYNDIINIVKTKDYIIARGNGRCYGDASLAKNTISTLHLNKILSFNEIDGTITSQVGVLLDEILQVIVPKGFFLPVTPGTKFITVGGALASDIHGKNHHVDGVFSDHVNSFKLINNEGEIVTVYRNDDLFVQTAGGMGATGIITEVTFRLKQIESSFIIMNIFVIGI